MRIYPGQRTKEVSAREAEIRRIARKAAAEGMVLLENDGVLPLTAGTRLALFGRGARHTIKGGTGSGDVNARNTVTVAEGLEKAGFRIVNSEYLDRFDEQYRQCLMDWEASVYRAAGPERDPGKFYLAHASTGPALPETAIEPGDAEGADVLVYVISRVSGEFADRHAEKGDYYLSDREESELQTLAGFGKPLVILLNTGGIVDLSILEKIRADAVLLISQPGSEGGSAVADVLGGQVNPSGRLTDTWAFRYEDYPSSASFSHRDGNLIEERYTDGIFVGYRYFDSFEVRPRYPFGYGLSYTRFSEEILSAETEGTEIRIRVRVRNEGGRAGRQVVQLYAACPSGELMTERKRLVAFGKTGLLEPGREEILQLSFDLGQLSVYHEGRAAWILQKGCYRLYAGENAADFAPAVRLKLEEEVLAEQVRNICELQEALNEIRPEKPELPDAEDAFPLTDIDITAAARQLKTAYPMGPAAAEEPETWQAKEIAARMTLREKACLTVGARSAMAGEIVGVQAHTVPGAAGETVALPRYGIPGMVLADGPAGVRIYPEYEVDPETGEVIEPGTRFEMLEARFFGKEFYREGSIRYYQIATAVPIGTLLAQSFDTALLEEVGNAVAQELKAFGIAVWLAPGMNIHRNPLCGRNFEYYSEDPLVSGLMAAAITRGVQKNRRTGVSIKHFACNNQEDNRMHVNELISERTLREIYLKGFEIAVKTSDPMTIMTSYNRINGVHSANNTDLCTEVARKEWGFRGFVMTDWGTTNRGGSRADKCIAAGNDLVMPGQDSDIREIIDAVEGRIGPRLPEEKLNESVIRLIRTALICGETHL